MSPCYDRWSGVSRSLQKEVKDYLSDVRKLRKLVPSGFLFQINGEGRVMKLFLSSDIPDELKERARKKGSNYHYVKPLDGSSRQKLENAKVFRDSGCPPSESGSNAKVNRAKWRNVRGGWVYKD